MKEHELFTYYQRKPAGGKKNEVTKEWRVADRKRERQTTSRSSDWSLVPSFSAKPFIYITSTRSIIWKYIWPFSPSYLKPSNVCLRIKSKSDYLSNQSLPWSDSYQHLLKNLWYHIFHSVQILNYFLNLLFISN